MPKRLQDLFEYSVGQKKIGSVCRIEIYDTTDKTVVIFGPAGAFAQKPTVLKESLVNTSSIKIGIRA